MLLTWQHRSDSPSLSVWAESSWRWQVHIEHQHVGTCSYECLVDACQRSAVLTSMVCSHCSALMTSMWGGRKQMVVLQQHDFAAVVRQHPHKFQVHPSDIRMCCHAQQCFMRREIC